MPERPGWPRQVAGITILRLRDYLGVIGIEAGRMEILGIGTDIIECPRIGKMVENHGEMFLRRVYTEREIRYCQARKHAIEHFAGRWAAKEAILKAIGTGRGQGVAWTDIEVRNGPDGRPQ